MPEPMSLEKVALHKYSLNYKNNAKKCHHSSAHARRMWEYNDAQEHNVLNHIIDQHNACHMRIVGHSI